MNDFEDSGKIDGMDQTEELDEIIKWKYYVMDKMGMIWTSILLK